MVEKQRVLALDVGDVRIGVAVSDPFGWTAQGLESYTRVNESKDREHILQWMKQYAPVTLLFGMPRNMNGSYGPQAEKIQAYADELTAWLQGQVVFDTAFFDERLTTAAAERILISADVSRKKRKQVIDKMAAVQILQGYLDANA
jgi:RNAse H-fold protein YqgF